MLKIKLDNLSIGDIKRDDYIKEYELNKICGKLIFPVYAVNDFVEAIELLQEEDNEYYILRPCIISEWDNIDMVTCEPMEDFKDILDAINIFFEFNIANILEIEPNSFKSFMLEFLENSTICASEYESGVILIDLINPLGIKLNVTALDCQICFDMQLINAENNIVLIDNVMSFNLNKSIEDEDLEYFLESLDGENLKEYILNNL